MKRFRVAPGLVLTCCVLIFLGYVKVLWAFLLAAFCHELGHILALLLMGTAPRWILLHSGEAVIGTETLSSGRMLVAAAAGPAVNLILAWCLRRSLPLASFLNGFLCIYNLLPIYPLDGGRILAALLRFRCSEGLCRTAVHLTSFAVSLLLMLLTVWMTVLFQAGVLPCLCMGVTLIRLEKSASAEGF